MHMRELRQMGRRCREEAEAALQSAAKNQAMAENLLHYMRAYDLLTEYYERKLLAAISALVYAFGGPDNEQERALQLADETVELYQRAADYIYEHIDHRSGQLTGGWWDERTDLPGLVKLEKKDRIELPELFRWNDRRSTPEMHDKANLGTTEGKTTDQQ
jgi:hypothetical protein